MRKRYSRLRVNVKKSHSDSMLRNLLLSLLDTGTLVTTVSRAKMLKRYADSEISYAVSTGLTNGEKQIMAHAGHPLLTKRLLEYRAFVHGKEINTNGSFTTSVNAGIRSGDNAPTIEVKLMHNDAYRAYLESIKPKKKAKKVKKAVVKKTEGKIEKKVEKLKETDKETVVEEKQVTKKTKAPKTTKKKDQKAEHPKVEKKATPTLPPVERRESFFARLGGRILGRRVQGPTNQKGRSTARSGI